MKRVVIVQARLTSSRLPGKVLMDLAGQPMLARQIRRLKLCSQIDEIVIATTINDTDDPIVALAAAEGVRWFRGSENDVLSRYVGAAREAKADMVVRITADCPLIDSEQTDRVIKQLQDQSNEFDYASNVVVRTFPRGLDTEAFFTDVIERLNRIATSVPAREHVTHYIITEHPELFAIHSIYDLDDNSDLRWTVDTSEDIAMVRRIYRDLGDQTPYRQVLEYVRLHPEVASVNTHVKQKTI